MYYLHSEAKAKRLRLRLYREKGELELVVWYVAVLISDLSQHCVLRGPKRRGLTEAARLLLVVVRGRGYHDITLGLTLLKISFEHFSLGYFPKTSQFIEPRKVSMGLFYIPNSTLTDWYVLSVQVPCLDYLQLQTQVMYWYIGTYVINLLL